MKSSKNTINRDANMELNMKFFSMLINHVSKRRKELDFEKYGENKKIKRKRTIKVPIKNNTLFRIYKEMCPFVQDSYLPFVDAIMKVLDDVDEIENAPSVTTREEASVMRVRFRTENFPESSFDKISKVTLVQHILDIVLLIIDKHNDNINPNSGIKHDMTFSIAEVRQLLFLALTHDIGKLDNLTKKMKINFSDKNHEERSSIFFDMFIFDAKYGEHTMKQAKRVQENIKKMSCNEKNSTIVRFNEFDALARVKELKEFSNGED